MRIVIATGRTMGLAKWSIDDTHVFYFLIPVKPHFLQEPEDITTTSGSSISLVCSVSGDPKPIVAWKRLEGELPTKRIVKNGVLTLENVGPEDEGVYECEAKNLIGSITSSASLSVHGMICKLLPLFQNNSQVHLEHNNLS